MALVVVEVIHAAGTDDFPAVGAIEREWDIMVKAAL